MNSHIETLNRWGEQFLNFAWPMLWQSSVLIAAVFVLDLALRRKVRASVRHALWLVVLVKLVLPPTLALPTGPSWWIHPAAPPQPVKAPPVSFTVTYGEQVMPDISLPPAIIVPPKPPALTAAAWTVVLSGGVSAGLLAWLLIRWRQVHRKVRRANDSGTLQPILGEAQRLTQSHPGVRLKLTEDTMSPAVCGLFRPVILLPQSLVEKLSAEQLRAVLLHEAIHLRRGDVWVNCAQALLQIVYWWHPLLWLASARIRRVREEAVDDAVMLALRDDADIYAPTLLEVAKFAFRRPLASLGLVGILESRSALRQRIERLVNFNAPKKAGLTVVSILGILAFSAVALPMGQAPEKTNAPNAPVSDSTIGTNAAESAQLVRDGKLLYEMGKLDDAEAKMRAALALNPDTQAAHYYLDLIAQSRQAPTQQEPKIIYPAPNSSQTNALPQATDLEARVFNVNPNTFAAGLRGVLMLHTNPVTPQTDFAGMAVTVFGRLGVDLTAHGRSLAYSVGKGLLYVRATPSELDNIERIVQALNQTAPQIHIKARFIEVPESEVGAILQAGTAVDTNTVEIIAADKMKSLLHQLESASGVKTLAEPESVVAHGRQVQMRSTNSTVDLVPLLLMDGYTLHLLTIVSKPETRTARVNVWEGQTLALVFPGSDAKNRLVIFITSWIIDPAGNRVHSDEDLRLMQEKAKSDIPPQRTLILSDPNSRPTIHALEQRTGVENLAEPEPVTAAGRGADKTESSQLVQDGKLLYEMGKFEDAEAKLKAALALNPDNQGAFYYLRLVRQAFYAREGHNRTNQPANSTEEVPKAWSPKVGIGMPVPNPYVTNADTHTPSGRDPTAPQFEMRVFKVDTNAFASGLRGVRNLQTNDIVTMAINFFGKMGVDLSAPGRSIAINDRLGLLFVRATPPELDTIERAVQALNQIPPQIHIKARFIEVEQTSNPANGFDWYLGSFSNSPVVTNGRGVPSLAAPVSAANAPGSFPGNTTTSVIPASATGQQLTSGLRNTVPAPGTATGIMTDPNFRVTLHALESRPRTTILAEPECVTTSGRQTQMRATDIHTVPTGINPLALKPPGVSSNELFLTEQVECGPVFDVVPYVLSDRYTINLTTTASVIEFLGYDKPTNSVTAYINGKKQTVPVPLPKFRTQKISTVVNLWDNQTLVLSGPVTSVIQPAMDKVPLLGDLPLVGGLFRSQSKTGIKTEKQLMVFVTATIVDPAGNRAHSDDNLPFNPTTIPPQPQTSSPSR
jgi:type II secretory pathway component GspD/PulD (secretin)/beta-lactamase regulating signal transducer with metallopeptidase domain